MPACNPVIEEFENTADFIFNGFHILDSVLEIFQVGEELGRDKEVIVEIKNITKKVRVKVKGEEVKEANFHRNEFRSYS